MRAHKSVVPLVLFALAFVGALLVMRQPGASAPAVPSVDVSAPREVPLPVVSSMPAMDRLRALPEPLAADISEPPDPAPPAVDEQLASDTIDAATDTLKYSVNPDDRVRALRSLAVTGRDGVEVARVRSSLHLAATDDDPDIAARAQEEYESLVDRDDR